MSGQQHAPIVLYPGTDPLPILKETGWAPGQSARGENLVPTGIRSRNVQLVVTILCSTAKCEQISGCGNDIYVVSFSGAIMSEIFNTMTPGTVVVWTSIYFATSVIWLLISGFLLYGRLHKKHSQFM